MMENSILVDKKLSHYIEYDFSNPMKSMRDAGISSTSGLREEDKEAAIGAKLGSVGFDNVFLRPSP